jgi:two-component system sensor histidine kinase KdpD
MTDQRPNPDELLKQVQQEQQTASRGKLKIFFGASPGVGKTYAMLLEAGRLRAQGLDVVVGVVETHGRSETAALLEGIEVLARKDVMHRGGTLHEFDLDAALKRRPAVLLVDELAHTNAPGCRHPKRWQDVEELLAAGIDVLTTVNVQHIESLNDIVGGITGIRVQETVPDTCSPGRTKSCWWICHRTICWCDCAKARCTCRNRPSAPSRIFFARAT